MDEVESAVRTLVAELCGVAADTIALDTDLRAYGMDSVRGIELLVRLEEAFGVSLPDESLTFLKTTSDVARYVIECRERARLGENEDA